MPKNTNPADAPALKNAAISMSGETGGLLVGKRHKEGGIQAINKSTGERIEMEGGEVVITRDAVADTEKREFEGKLLTNREILSEINESGGGVSFADGGEIPGQIQCTGKQYKIGGEMKTDREIIESCGCQSSMAEGGSVNDYFNNYTDEQLAEDSKNGVLIEAVLEGKVTAMQAKDELESRGIEVPNVINHLVLKNQSHTQTFEQFCEERDKPKREYIDDVEASIAKLSERLDKINNTTSYTDQLAKSFPLGVGYNNARLRKIKDRELDKTITNAVTSIEIRNKIEWLKNRLVAYKAGKVNENGQPKVASIPRLTELIEYGQKTIKAGKYEKTQKELTGEEKEILKDTISHWKKQLAIKSKKYREEYERIGGNKMAAGGGISFAEGGNLGRFKFTRGEFVPTGGDYHDLILYFNDKIVYKASYPNEDVPGITSQYKNIIVKKFAFGGVLTGSDVATGTPVTLKYLKNTEKAPYLGSRFGQDVEPAGFYFIQKETFGDPSPGWVEGEIHFKNPLVIDVTGDTLISYKYDLSNQYGHKTGKQLTKFLQKLGYDGIITRVNGDYLGEIIAFNHHLEDGGELEEDRRSILIDEALDRLDEMNVMYRVQFASDPQTSLRELAEQLHQPENVNTAQRAFGVRICEIAKELYPNIGNEQSFALGGLVDDDKLTESAKLAIKWRTALAKYNGVNDETKKLQAEYHGYCKKYLPVVLRHRTGLNMFSKKGYDYGEIDWHYATPFGDNYVFNTVVGGKFEPTEIAKKVGYHFSPGGGSAFDRFSWSDENYKIVKEKIEQAGYKVVFDESNSYAQGGKLPHGIAPNLDDIDGNKKIGHDLLEQEVKKYKSVDQLLRSGGITDDALRLAAFGFIEDSVTELMPNVLSIKWKEDEKNVQQEIEKSGKSKQEWAKGISLETPIDVSFDGKKFFIEDGHHRYSAAKILRVPLKVNLEIRANPIKYLSEKDYDAFHKEMFNQVNKMAEGGQINESKWEKIASGSSRFRPKERIEFDPPLVGKSGATLLAYEWQWDGEIIIDKRGEEKLRRFSDWSRAEMSGDTGRDIVHQYEVRMPDGTFKTVSSESVLVLLGYTERNAIKAGGLLLNAVKTLAKQKMQLAVAEAQYAEFKELKALIESQPLPEYTTEPLIDDKDGRMWAIRIKMGEASVFQHSDKMDVPIEAERIECLKSSYVRMEIEKRGLEYYVCQGLSSKIYDIKNRIIRQERKVSQLTKAQQENKFEDGGTLRSKLVDNASKQYTNSPQRLETRDLLAKHDMIEAVNAKARKQIGKDMLPQVDNPNIIVSLASEVPYVEAGGRPNKCETNAFEYCKKHGANRYFPVGGYMINRSFYPIEHWWIYDSISGKQFDVTPDESADVPKDYVKGYVGVIEKTLADEINQAEYFYDVDFFKGGNVQSKYLNPLMNNTYAEGGEVDNTATLNQSVFVRDTLIDKDRFNALPLEKRQVILSLVDEFNKLGYIDARTQIGGDQAARMTDKQRSQITGTASKVFAIEMQIKDLLKSEHQVSREIREAEIKRLEGRNGQIERQIKDLETISFLKKKIESPRSNHTKTAYYQVKDELLKNLDRINELKSYSGDDPHSSLKAELGLMLNDPYTAEQIAAKHHVSVDYAKQQLAKGERIEREHSQDGYVQYVIASQHLYENVEYYNILEDVHLAEGGEIQQNIEASSYEHGGEVNEADLNNSDGGSVWDKLIAEAVIYYNLKDIPASLRTRLLHSELLSMEIPHYLMRGSFNLNNKIFDVHEYIQLYNGNIVDYAAGDLIGRPDEQPDIDVKAYGRKYFGDPESVEILNDEQRREILHAVAVKDNNIIQSYLSKL